MEKLGAAGNEFFVKWIIPINRNQGICIYSYDVVTNVGVFQS